MDHTTDSCSSLHSDIIVVLGSSQGRQLVFALEFSHSLTPISRFELAKIVQHSGEKIIGLERFVGTDSFFLFSDFAVYLLEFKSNHFELVKKIETTPCAIEFLVSRDLTLVAKAKKSNNLLKFGSSKLDSQNLSAGLGNLLSKLYLEEQRI